MRNRTLLIMFLVAFIASIVSMGGDLSALTSQLPEWIASSAWTLFVFALIDRLVPGSRIFT